MMGLRLTEGISRVRLERTAGQSVEALFGRNLTPLIDAGFVTLDQQSLSATVAGRQRLNAVLAALIC